MMQSLVNMLAGFIAFLAAAVLSHFGVAARSEGPQREVHRTSDCRDAPTSSMTATVTAAGDHRSC